MQTLSDTAQLLTVLARQNELLTQILDTLKQPKLGLHSDSGACYLYCNRQHGSLWYSLTADRTPQPIAATALTGYLTALEFPKLERRGKEVIKLQATFRGDRLYVLESGYDSHFAKGLLAAVASLTPQRLRHPLTIAPAPGEDESVLFCRTYQDKELVFAPYSDETDWRQIANQALHNVRAAAMQE